MPAKDFLYDVPTTPTALSALANLPTHMVHVSCPESNIGTVYIGGPVHQPHQLAGGMSMPMYRPMSDIYVYGSVAGLQIALTIYWN